MKVIALLRDVGRVRRGFMPLLLGAGIGQAIGLAAAPLLTRLFGPAEFGALAVYSSLAVLEVAACLAYERAIPLAKTEDDTRGVVVLALGIATVLSAAVFLLIAFLGPALGALPGVMALGRMVWLLPVTVLATGANLILTNLALRRGQFGKVAAARMFQSIAVVALQVCFAAVGLIEHGLVLGFVLGSVCGSVMLAVTVVGVEWTMLLGVRFARIRELAHRYMRFPLLSGGALLLNNLSAQLPTLWLAALFGTPVAGSYMVATRLIGTPASLVSGSLAQAFFSHLSRLRVDGASGRLIRQELIQTLVWQCISGLPLLVAAWLAPLFFTAVLGNDWEVAGEYARLLAVMFYVQYLVTPAYVVLNVLERQDLHMLSEMGRLAIVIAFLLPAAPQGWSHERAVAMLSAGITFGYVLSGALAWWAILRDRRDSEDPTLAES